MKRKNVNVPTSYEEIATIKENKLPVESCIKDLEVDIEQYSISAEKEKNLSLLTKANSFRVTVREKKELLLSLHSTCEKLEQELKDI